MATVKSNFFLLYLQQAKCIIFFPFSNCLTSIKIHRSTISDVTLLEVVRNMRRKGKCIFIFILTCNSNSIIGLSLKKTSFSFSLTETIVFWFRTHFFLYLSGVFCPLIMPILYGLFSSDTSDTHDKNNRWKEDKSNIRKKKEKIKTVQIVK
jgi:hypothetical protein